MTVVYGPPSKPKPKVGDRKLIKGVMHVRQHVIIEGGLSHRHGKYHYEWVPVTESVYGDAGVPK